MNVGERYSVTIESLSSDLVGGSAHFAARLIAVSYTVWGLAELPVFSNAIVVGD